MVNPSLNKYYLFTKNKENDKWEKSAIQRIVIYMI